MHILYYITDRKQLAAGAAEQKARLLEKIAEAARAGVDYIQLREKDLLARDLERLARDAVRCVRDNSQTTKLLVNSRVDVALASGADGVHLTSADIPASDARAIHALASRHSKLPARFIIGASCHTVAEVQLAYAHGADFVVFGPVFEKVAAPARAGIGIETLREMCKPGVAPAKVEAGQPVHIPVLALGGVTLANAGACFKAGAAGIAAIRLFQENKVAEIVSALRDIASSTRG